MVRYSIVLLGVVINLRLALDSSLSVWTFYQPVFWLGQFFV